MIHGQFNHISICARSLTAAGLCDSEFGLAKSDTGHQEVRVHELPNRLKLKPPGKELHAAAIRWLERDI